jgi:hypothetical protein
MGVLLVAAFSSLAGWLANAGTTIVGMVTIEGIKWTAQKAFWFFVMTVVLPVLFYNIACSIVISLMQVSMALAYDYSNIDTTAGSLTLQLTGMAGYIANQIYLPQCFANFMSAVAIRFVLQFLPGIK